MRARVIIPSAFILVLAFAGLQVLRRAPSHPAESSFSGNSAVLAAETQLPSAPVTMPQAVPAKLSFPVVAVGMSSPESLTAKAVPMLHAVADKPDLSEFARCLAKKQVSMYGAYWCPHCAEQKEKFGQAFKYVPYVECAVVGQPPAVQTPACREMQIHKYPTWVFPDGDRVEAIQTLEQLSQRTGCKLP